MRISRISDLVLFLRVGLWSVLVPLILEVSSVPGALGILTPKRMRTRTGSSVQKAVAYAEFWLRVRNRIKKTTCYQRSAILYRCLRERGLPVRIAIGLKVGAPLTGHSWLVLNGRPFLERRKDLKAFTVTYLSPA